MNPESIPTPQQPPSPEDRKQKIDQLQAELQVISQDDPSRGDKLKELIALVEEDEIHEGGEIPVPEHALATNSNYALTTDTNTGAPVDMIKPEQPFAQVKEEAQQN